MPDLNIGLLFALGWFFLILLAAEQNSAAEPAMIWPSRPTYHILRVAARPQLDGADPLADPLWQQAEAIGPLLSGGRPEPAGRQTEIRMLCTQGELFIAARCDDPQPDRIRAARDGRDLWRGDSLEFFFTSGPEPGFPYLHVQVDAAGRCSVRRYLKPFVQRTEQAASEYVDPAGMRVRAGISSSGWWAVLAIPLQDFDIPRSRFFFNVVRNRPADGSDYAWIDTWRGRSGRPSRFAPVLVVDAPPPPVPRLELPASLAVGRNRLRLADWRDDWAFRINGEPVAVAPDGRVEVPVTRHGTMTAEIVDRDGRTVTVYTAEVRRGLIVEADEPFQADLSRPIRVHLWLNIAGGAAADVVLEASQNGKRIAEQKLKLAAGTHEVELPHQAAQAGEVEITATAEVPSGTGKPIRLTAHHRCMVGVGREAVDRFRADIDGLPTLSLYRAGLADACNFYRLIQAGDGRYRSMDKSGRLSFSDWSYGMVYAFALLYKADWPENPYRGDRRFLESAAAGMEAGLDPRIWYASLEHPPNRHLQGYLLAYDLLKDEVSPEQAEYWRGRLVQLVEATIELWLRPAEYRYSYFSADVGTGTNHYAYHVANVYTAGKVLNRPDWTALGRKMMLRLTRHERDGHFPERRVVPATHYTWLTMNALGEYFVQSGDERVKPNLLRCVEFSCHTSLPTGEVMLLHDGRVNGYYPFDFGDFVLSLTPCGRSLARVRAMRHIGSGVRPSRSAPEFWFRTAENAAHFQPGPQAELPAETEFAFLDGRGLIARRQGFIYGLSALSVPPVVRRYWVDPQNAIELHHVRVGPILHGANSQQQPEAGSFYRKHAERVVFMPSEGQIDRTDRGHQVLLQFDTFAVRLVCEVLSAELAEVRVELLAAEGDEPVVYNFFPGVRSGEELARGEDGKTLRFRDVTIECNKPVKLERNFRIINPYSLRRSTSIKPVRAYTDLEPGKPFVLRIRVAGGD